MLKGTGNHMIDCPDVEFACECGDCEACRARAFADDLAELEAGER